jgi:5-methylcytosine-specific restriction endonuclease McrA
MSKLNKLSIDEIKEIVANSYSSAEACKNIGLANKSGSTTRFKKFLINNNIDHSHWTGQLWSKGKTSLEDKRIKSTGNTYEDVFCVNSLANPTYVKTLIIKKELLPYCCSICNMKPVWKGKELKLQMDHINGVRNDHRLENLRIICPNCHSQTETFGSKNKKKTFPSEERIIEVLKNTACITQAIRVLAINNVNHKKLQLIANKYEIVQKSS